MKLRQIRLSLQLFNQIHLWCIKKRYTLSFFYDMVMQWFLNTHHPSTPMEFLASTKNGKIVSLWLKEQHIQKIQNIALSAQVSDARVIHTAIMCYIKEHRFFDN